MEVAVSPACASFRRASCTGLASSARRLLIFLAAAALIWMLLPEPVRAQSSQRPVAVAGTYPAIADTDGLPGEPVLLNGTGSFDPDGTIISYVWLNAQGAQIAAGPTPSVRLPDGTNSITLVVEDDFPGNGEEPPNNTGSNTVSIIVRSSSAPTADAGGSRTIDDSDGQPGEDVTLDGSASSDPDGNIASWQWYRGSQLLGSGVTLAVRLPDAANAIRLVVTDNVGLTATSAIAITVRAAGSALGDVSDYPTGVSLGNGLQSVCEALEAAEQSGSTLTAEQADLLATCRRIVGAPLEEQARTLAELGAQDLNAIRAQALLFTNHQIQALSSRLAEVRSDRANAAGGSRLNFLVDGHLLPLDLLGGILKSVFGADDEAGGLLSDRLGLWMRGDYDQGKKSASNADQGYDGSQWLITGGADYRLGSDAVLGLSLARGSSSLDFNPTGQGGLSSKTWNLSVYGSSFLFGNAFMDAIVDYGRPRYRSERRILFDIGGVQTDRTASGSTDGKTLSATVSGGYDFMYGPLTVTPTVNYRYIDTRVDGFAEQGAAGLDLAYDSNRYRSATLNAGLSASYVWNTRFAVLQPHFSVQYARELYNQIESFGISFLNDPNAGTSGAVVPSSVYTDKPDPSYWRASMGVSAQFIHGVSGFVEYQKLLQFEHVSLQTFTIGLRIQHAFGR
jgi:outer membrane autotransporter protein